MDASHTEATALNREAALARMGGDQELLHEIALLFLEEYPSALQNLRKAVETRDSLVIEHTAHTLKGSVLNFGAEAAAEAASRLEILGRTRKTVEFPGALETLEAAMVKVQAELVAL